MEYAEARSRIIDAWGALGTNWGISRTMAQIHAVLMLSPEPMTTDDVIEELRISRGNVSMSLRSLLDWGIVRKVYKPGQRKELYESEKDVWELATQVAKERRRRELEPIIRVLEDVQNVKDASVMKSKVTEMNKMTKHLLKFAKQSDKFLSMFIKSEESWFFSKILKLLK